MILMLKFIRHHLDTIAGIDIYRLEDGRLAEHWHVIDQLTMLQQLGLLPAADGAPA